MKTQVLTLVLLGTTVALSLHATTYYVSPTGSNNNVGTSVTKPWQSISKVNSTNFKGDTVLFQGGSTFSGSMDFTSSDVGTSSKPIVIGSYGTGRATISSGNSYGIYVYNAAGFKINNLIFKGSGRTTNTQSGVFFYMDKATTLLPYVKIDKVEAYGYYNSGISIGSWKQKSGYSDVSVTNSVVHDNGKAGISFYAESLYVHKNVYIGYTKAFNNSGIASQTTGNSGSGIALGEVDGAVIEYCTSYNNGWLHSNSYGGPMGIWAYGSNNVTIQYNESYQNKTGSIKDGGGFDLDACKNSTMQYNYSHDNHGGGFVLVRYSTSIKMDNLTVRYNISENDGRKNDYGGIHVSGNTAVISNVQIYNNTIYITPATNAIPKAFFNRGGYFSNVRVRNNIFHTTGGVLVLKCPSSSAFTFQGNNYWSSGSTFKIAWGSTTYSSLTSWRTATGKEKVNGTASGLQVDPLFSSTTTGTTFSDATQITQLQRYKLKSTSGLINKGLNLSTLFGTNVGSRDFWGNSLANKSSFHVGAFQGTGTARPALVSNSELTGTGENEQLLKAFPNPFGFQTTVSFVSPNSGKASIMLYNAEGKAINSLFSGEMRAGEFKKLTLNAAVLANGVHIVRLFSGDKVVSKKIIVSK